MNESWQRAILRIRRLKHTSRLFHLSTVSPLGTVDELLCPTDQVLRSAYLKLSAQKSSNRDCERTHKERTFLKGLKLHSQKQVLPSVRIGGHCVDLFVPNIRSSENGTHVMRGLAIEVDGDIHNDEGKMRKDELKNAMLSILGIGMTSIPNWDLREPTVRILQQQLGSFRRLDSRERQRLWRRIYVLTLAWHLSDREFLSLFTKHSRSVPSGPLQCNGLNT